MKFRPPKDRKATERKRSEGVISKAHQYARICKGDIAVFICNEDGKCKAYQSSNRKIWGTFFEQLKDEQPWIVHIEPDDLDDNGRKKQKRKRSVLLKKNPLAAKKNDSSSLQLPEFPTIQSESEEWLLLDAIADSLEHTGMRPSKVGLDIPEKILLNAKAVCPTVDMLQFPEPPAFEFDSSDSLSRA